jgi:predicted DNA-binding protein (UPF0251 family)
VDKPVKTRSKPDTFIKSSFLPNPRIPNIRTIVRIVQHLRDHGSYKPQIQDRSVQRPRRAASTEEDILKISHQVCTSSRRLARQHNISQSTVWQITIKDVQKVQ